MGQSGRQPNINKDIIKSHKVVLPHYNEQIKIASYLDEKTVKIDQAVQKIQEQMEKLKEYRASLIYHTVIGKIKI